MPAAASRYCQADISGSTRTTDTRSSTSATTMTMTMTGESSAGCFLVGCFPGTGDRCGRLEPPCIFRGQILFLARLTTRADTRHRVVSILFRGQSCKKQDLTPRHTCGLDRNPHPSQGSSVLQEA